MHQSISIDNFWIQDFEYVHSSLYVPELLKSNLNDQALQSGKNNKYTLILLSFYIKGTLKTHTHTKQKGTR